MFVVARSPAATEDKLSISHNHPKKVPWNAHWHIHTVYMYATNTYSALKSFQLTKKKCRVPKIAHRTKSIVKNRTKEKKQTDNADWLARDRILSVKSVRVYRRITYKICANNAAISNREREKYHFKQTNVQKWNETINAREKKLTRSTHINVVNMISEYFTFIA